MSETSTPDLATVIKAAIAGKLKGVRVGLPGRIETYDASTLTCTAQPLVPDGYYDETGARQTERLPVVTAQVVFQGGGGSRLTFPVAPGDTCWLSFGSSSLDRWNALGGEVDPLDDRRHHISDAVAFVGLSDSASASAASSTATVLEGSDVRIGDASAQLLALKADLTALKTAISGAAVVAGDGGAAFKANILAVLTSWPVGTTKAKGT